MAVETAPNLRLLKAVVIILGVAILAAVAAIVVTIAMRTGAVVADREPAAAPTPPAGFGTRALAIPAGAEIVAVTAAGDRLVLRLRRADGGDSLVVVDLEHGTRLGTIDLRPDPAQR